MRPRYYQNRWALLKDAPDAPSLESLSQRIASTFIDRHFYSDEYNQDCIHLLCDMATHFNDSALNQIAAGALFGTIIERLCDNFEELQTKTYNRLMCQVVSFLRKQPDGKALNEELDSFQLRTEQQLYRRIESIRLNPDERLADSLHARKILILSRVTIGADVAISSVICQRLARKFPRAEITVIGNAKLEQIFSVRSGIKIRALHYARRGGLMERFFVWLELLKEVRTEIAGIDVNEYLVLDPDSRLTQLGVLPLVPDTNYRFFSSRGKQGYCSRVPIAELTNLWLDNILAENEFCFPKIWLDEKSLASARHLRSASGSCKLISLNLGVGGDVRKRVPGKFETEMVLALLAEENTRVVLDLGFGNEETERSEAILEVAKKQGFHCQSLDFVKLSNVDENCQLLGLNCSIAEIASVIACSDEFIGYDSACQHIAAAEAVPTFTIFAGTNNVRFIRHWHSSGPNVSEIVYVDTVSKHKTIDNQDIIARLMDLRQTSG